MATINLSIPVPKKFEEKTYGKAVVDGNLSWRLTAKHFEDSALVQIECTSLDDTLFCREVHARFSSTSVFSRAGVWEVDMIGQRLSNEKMCSNILQINTLAVYAYREVQRFNSDPIVIDAVITTTGVAIRSVDRRLPDIDVVVCDKKYLATKQILGSRSDKLFEMIYSKPVEVDQIDIDSDDATGFGDFLKVLCNGGDVITLSNFEVITSLSQEFKAYQCLEECEKFLIKARIDKTHKLEYVKKFELSRVRDHVIKSLISKEDIDQLGVITDFDEKTQNALLELSVEIEGLSPKKIIDTVSISLDKAEMWFVNAANIPFTIKSTNKNDKQLITVCCNYLGANWECDATISVMENDKVISSTLFKFESDKEFVISDINADNTLKIDIHSTYKVCATQKFDFDTGVDVALSVGDNKYHVNRKILANNSNYFETLFYSDFKEKEQTDIELIGIDKDGFEETLYHIYNPMRLVDTKTVKSLLKISEMYNLSQIRTKCEKFLHLSDDMNDAGKLELAEKYRFHNLSNRIVSNIKTMNDFKKFSKLDGFQEMDSDIIAKLSMHVLNYGG